MAAMVHAIPIPKNTFTAFEPVTLPTEASAVSSSMAAVLLAKVSVTIKIFVRHERTALVELF